MQISRESKRSPERDQNTFVRIDVTHLDEDQIEQLKRALREDKLISSVESEVKTLYVPGLVYRRSIPLTYEISACAAPVFLIVQFLHTHAEALIAAAGTGTLSTVATAGTKYLINKLETMRRAKDASMKHVKLYGADGNVIKLVKIGKTQD